MKKIYFGAVVSIALVAYFPVGKGETPQQTADTSSCHLMSKTEVELMPG